MGMGCVSGLPNYVFDAGVDKEGIRLSCLLTNPTKIRFLAVSVESAATAFVFSWLTRLRTPGWATKIPLAGSLTYVLWWVQTSK